MILQRLCALCHHRYGDDIDKGASSSDRGFFLYTPFCFELLKCSASSSTLTTDTTRQLNILGHDGDALGVDGTQVGVLEKTDEVSLGGLL